MRHTFLVLALGFALCLASGPLEAEALPGHSSPSRARVKKVKVKKVNLKRSKVRKHPKVKPHRNPANQGF